MSCLSVARQVEANSPAYSSIPHRWRQLRPQACTSSSLCSKNTAMTHIVHAYISTYFHSAKLLYFRSFCSLFTLNWRTGSHEDHPLLLLAAVLIIRLPLCMYNHVQPLCRPLRVRLHNAAATASCATRTTFPAATRSVSSVSTTHWPTTTRAPPA